MPKKKQRDYSQWLIFAALAVTTARYIGAFVISDMGQITGWVSDVVSILIGISGAGMGFLDVLGMAYVFDGWRRNIPRAEKKATTRYKLLTVFVVGMAIVSVGILTPFTVARMEHKTMGEVMGVVEWAWSVAVNIAPFLLLGGVILGNDGVVTVATEAPTQTTEAPTQSNYRCKYCTETFGKPTEIANHVRHKHPEKSNHKANVTEVER